MTLKRFDRIPDTLSYFGIKWGKPYYVSSGNQLLDYPEVALQIDYFMFCIVLSGASSLEIDFQRITVTSGNIFIAAPSSVINLKNPTADFRFKLLFFEKNFLLRNVNDAFIMDRFPYFKDTSFNNLSASPAQATGILNILNYIGEKCNAEGMFKDEIISTLIFNMALEIAELFHSVNREDLVSQNISKYLYHKFLKLVKENIIDYKGVQYYADKLHVSNKYLIQFVKTASGKTPHEVINDILLKESLVLLNKPYLNLSEIAYTLKFNSLSAFSRYFKNATGEAPASYRKKRKIR